MTVAYTNTPRPFDADGLRDLVWHASAPAGRGAAVVVVEPYLAGTSARVVAEALADVPHRFLGLGVGRADLHRYGIAGRPRRRARTRPGRPARRHHGPHRRPGVSRGTLRIRN